jgi:hypothetical protein
MLLFKYLTGVALVILLNIPDLASLMLQLPRVNVDANLWQIVPILIVHVV